MFLELILLVVLLVCLRWFVFKSRTERLYDKIPGPKSYPFIGNLMEFDYPKVEITDTLKQLSFKYGPVYMMRIGLEATICLRDPSDIEVLLSSKVHIDKAPLYWPLFPWLNQGLLTSAGEKWRKHRKILTPAFHFSVLEKFVPVFVKNSSILVNKLSKMVGQELEVTKLVALCSLDIISETAMGLEVNAQLTESKYLNAVNELQEIIAHRNWDVLERSFLFPLLPIGRKHDKLIKYLHGVTENVMKERKAKLQKNTEEDSNDADQDVGIKKKKVFLDLLLEYQRQSGGTGMTDTEIRDEVDTFMFEGYDTTTSTISFCLYALSQHQHVQEKAFEEMCEIFGDSERDLSYQDLQEMKYLEKVIKETLRLYPTVQFIARRAAEDVQLNSGYLVPKGTSFILLLEAMNHDPQLHPEPFKFDPDRFDQRTANPYTFVPFSAGSRNCIGQRYAMMEVKAVVSLLLRKFRLLPSDVPVTSWFNIVLKSKTGIHLRFEPRAE